MISRMVTIFVSTLLFAAVLSLPLYSYEDVSHLSILFFFFFFAVIYDEMNGHLLRRQ